MTTKSGTGRNSAQKRIRDVSADDRLVTFVKVRWNNLQHLCREFLPESIGERILNTGLHLLKS